MEQIIKDDELGEVILHHNLRAKYYSLQVKNGQVIGTIPRGGSVHKMREHIEFYREKLIRLLRDSPQRVWWNERIEVQTYTFRVHVFRTAREDFYMTLKGGVLHIACPEDTDFENEQTQQILRMFFERALLHEAHRVLPGRLKMLAERYHFNYAGVTIRNTKGRWGSCSSLKRINLSLSLMRLPEHLIDYVLLHELCHTVEMNHGDRFWRLMDRVTDGRAQQFRTELKGYSMT